MLAIIHTENTNIRAILQIFYEFVWDMLLQTPLEGLDVRSSNNRFREAVPEVNASFGEKALTYISAQTGHINLTTVTSGDAAVG